MARPYRQEFSDSHIARIAVIVPTIDGEDIPVRMDMVGRPEKVRLRGGATTESFSGIFDDQTIKIIDLQNTAADGANAVIVVGKFDPCKPFAYTLFTHERRQNVIRKVRTPDTTSEIIAAFKEAGFEAPCVRRALFAGIPSVTLKI